MKNNCKVGHDFKNLYPQLNGIDTIMGYLKSGFEIGDIHFSNYDDNTRFVIMEKYPEKFKDPVYDDGKFTTFNFHVNVEIRKPISCIKTKFIIKENKEI